MNDAQLETLDQVQHFLEGTEAISFQIEGKDARYRWLQHTQTVNHKNKKARKYGLLSHIYAPLHMML